MKKELLLFAFFLSILSTCPGQSGQGFSFGLTSAPVELNLPAPASRSDKYRFNGAKVAGLGIIASASFVDGVLEGYQFDGRRSFERKWGADPEGFWGSQSWRRVYVDGDPERGFKSWAAEQAGALDFYHVADDFRKWGYLSGGAVFVLGSSKGSHKFKHFALDFALVFATSSLAKRAGLTCVRN